MTMELNGRTSQLTLGSSCVGRAGGSGGERLGSRRDIPCVPIDENTAQ